jgi:hypothetical protein
VKIPILSCGKTGSYFIDIEFKELIETFQETTKKILSRDFGSWPPKLPERIETENWLLSGEGGLSFKCWFSALPIFVGFESSRTRGMRSSYGQSRGQSIPIETEKTSIQSQLKAKM